MEPLMDWSALLHDLLVEIARRIPSVEDFMAFRGVCTTWRAAASKGKFVRSRPMVPLLMLAEKEEDSDEREFYSLSRRKICMRLPLPEAKGKRCIEARFGWFLTLAFSGEVNLLNPFSRAQIQLPDFTEYDSCYGYNFIKRAVLSGNPSQTSDFVLMVIHIGSRFLGFWRPRDMSWTRIESRDGAFEDVNYYNGKFYAINTSGNIWVWDESAPDLKVAHILFSIDRQLLFERQPYLVESSRGELLVITRNGYLIEDDYSYGVDNFGVFRLDLMKREWKEITSLGDDAIFVGHNAATSIAASAFSDVIKSNCIYFSDDCEEAYSKDGEGKGGGKGKGGGEDMGIYNVKDQSIERFNVAESLSFICPPLWLG